MQGDVNHEPAASARVRAGFGFAAAAGVLLGMWIQMQSAHLQPLAAYGGAGLAALVLGGLAWRRSARWVAWILLCGAVFGWAWTGGRAHLRLSEALPEALESQDLVLVGVVASLPVERVDGLRFVFEVESARQGDRPVDVPARLMLGWYEPLQLAGSRGARETSGPDSSLAAGQRWRFWVRLKRPHGSLNPHGFDYELWLFEQGLRASGYVRTGAGQAPERWGDSGGHAVERWRQRVREALQARLGDSAAAGLLAALAVGDQAAIGRPDWDVFRATGIAHLVAISGLHVTMFAWLAAALVRALWRRSATLAWRCPAVVAARWVACGAAAAYAVLAGWGVPAQRTVYMLLAATLLRQAGLRWPWPAVLLMSALTVAVIDPWALLQPGFWLSFVAVAVLMADGDDHRDGEFAQPTSRDDGVSTGLPASTRSRRWLLGSARQALRAQVLVTLALAPLSMLLFQQTSVVGLAANLVAIPVVTLLITPLALFGVAWPPLWSLAAVLAEHGMAALAWLAAWPWASWQAAAPPGWALGVGLLGLAVLALPVPWAFRGLGLVLVWPLFMPPQARPAPGGFEVWVADVGQGNAVLLRTATHDLLYDAGPRYSRENDAGTRVLVPLLRALGVGRLDLMVLSHRDSDHVGGAAAVLQGVGARRLSSSLEPGHRLRAASVPHQPCVAGQRWVWDGVAFEVLHPLGADLAAAAGAGADAKPNTLSCVLRVSAARASALLVGDIERRQEQVLLARAPGQLRADVLLVPHHGSKTSSSEAWLGAVAPRWALVQAGYRNRFGHPAPEVVERYRSKGIDLVRTDQCGAWFWSSFDQEGRCERQVRRRYWHTISATDAQA